MEISSIGVIGIISLLLFGFCATTFVDVSENCPTCEGKGNKTIIKREMVECEKCNGSGVIPIIISCPGKQVVKEDGGSIILQGDNFLLEIHGLIVFTAVCGPPIQYNQTCPVCRGAGKKVKYVTATEICSLCNGTGNFEYRAPIYTIPENAKVRGAKD